ncbi:pyridoxamine 5'-phosphate oxidase [Neolewinella aurantiaca]|uniref:Pyridoxine/pyridoxamine 5'-phosphate oxidase n=1 Tax=Neolewinella aurantiaca TaxID=2602767 RepID=A0A5C7FER7_9BACT|nr:pyridoxamine 5'-phosphate oxidase [Neolewinella aurantiaca]
MDATNLREDYQAGELLESEASHDPFELFHEWFKTAQESKIPEPNAMVLATITDQNTPAARVVLLKQMNDEGFVFFTNYNSRKGHELAERPQAAAVFNWLKLQRQVRIEGRVEKVEEQVSIDYFESRPRKSQIGAWVSNQSEVIPGREVLEAAQQKIEDKYADEEKLPRPEHWGGYVIVPSLIEFWQGRRSRLHDRLVYDRNEDGTWTRVRLAP